MQQVISPCRHHAKHAVLCCLLLLQLCCSVLQHHPHSSRPCVMCTREPHTLQGPAAAQCCSITHTYQSSV